MMKRLLVCTVAALLGVVVGPAWAEPVGSGDGPWGAASVAPELRDQLATADPSDEVSVIVTLGPRADLSQVSGTTKAERLRQVIALLQATANGTQGPLLNFLAARQTKGSVSRFTPFWVFNGIAVTATAAVVEQIALRPEVQLITPDRTVEAQAALASTSAEPNLSLVDAPALWALGFDGQEIVVANMDTGVDVNHPDLSARWRGGTNSWFDPNGQHPATPTDVNGHGTWTMGVMVGGSSGGTGIGVAPGSRWIAVKIFDDAGVATSSDIHAGFQWLLDPDHNLSTPDAPDVVNNSWTMGSTGCNLEFQLDLQSLRAAGILPIFAAGNFGPGTSTSASPANNPEAFAVGATDNADALYLGSGRGPSACGEPQTIFPELVAPGVGVRTADLFGLYTQRTGTSLAAPHVAGAVALLLDAFPDLSADVQEDALETGAVDLGTQGPDDAFGFGRLNILASYDWLTTRADFTIAPAPASATTFPGGGVGYAVSATPLNGFTGDIALSLGGLSTSQAEWSFTPPSIAGGSGSAQLTITTAASLAPGTYPLTITGTSGSVAHTVSVALVVSVPADFGISVIPSSRTVKRGSSTTYLVSVVPQGGFAGAVKLSVTGVPSWATATFAPSSVVASGQSTLTVKTTGRTPKGTFTLTVVGQSGSLAHQSTATLIVK